MASGASFWTGSRIALPHPAAPHPSSCAMRPHTLPLLPTRCRSMSLDSGASLGSFIASDDELDGWLSEGEYGPGGGEGGEGDWRAALREATGG